MALIQLGESKRGIKQWAVKHWLTYAEVCTLMKRELRCLQDEDLSLTLGQLVESKRGIVTVATEAFALAGMMPFIYVEICTVIEYGPRRWFNIWNLMDLATYFLQVHAVFAFHFVDV